MKLRFLFVFTTAALWTGSALAGGYFIGNGGDGYQMNGGLFLTDLLEAGLEKSTLPTHVPIDPFIANNLKAWNPPFAFPREALAEKLSEIDREAKGLGVILSLVLPQYRWQLIRFHLGKVKDLEGRTVDLPESARVQIANRLDDVIRISGPAWVRLDDTNRVATLMHEVIFSLMKTEVYKNQPDGELPLMIQSARKTRELVALAFSPPTQRTRLASMAEADLDIPFLTSGSDSAAIWMMDVLDKNGLSSKNFDFPFSAGSSTSGIESFIADTCRSSSGHILSGYLSRPVYAPTLEPYESSFGTQIACRISVLTDNVFLFRFAVHEERECRRILETYIPKFTAAGLLH